jgi:diaminopimelate decarboxylase
MSAFVYTNGQLGAEGVTLADVAHRFGTPCYVYSRAAIENQWTALDKTIGTQDHLICYAVKANSNLAILNMLARLGSGFDIVSTGELQRVIKAEGDTGKVVFSGTGKRDDELKNALRQGIKCFNIESSAELLRLNEIAGRIKKRAPVSLRVNPDVDVETHPYIATGLKENKFGIPHTEAFAIYKQAASMDYIDVTGIDCHIGSQLTSLAPFTDALDRLVELIDVLERNGIVLQHVDVGGGLGIQYQDETPPTIEEYARVVLEHLTDKNRQLVIEPGRCITGNAGVLLTRVEYLKQTAHKNFAIVDAAMNDLLRPALYDAWHDILPLDEAPRNIAAIYDVVGPVCESGDFLGRGRNLAISEGDLLAICSAGAYGFSMSSNYNSRPRVCEVMIDRDKIYEIRKRESLDDLFAGESLLPDD